MSKPACYLALDQGSHGSKAALFDAGGKLVALAEVPLETRRPAPAFVEHDAEEVLDTLHEAIAEAIAQEGGHGAGIAGAGLAIQRSSIVCWDRNTGAALSPVISWQDRRNSAWLAAQALDPVRLRAITGLVASPHYGASKLRWCLDHLPAVQAAQAAGRLSCGPLASFVLHRLLGQRPFVVDPANAARTLLWELRSRDWSEELLAACAIPRACLPRSVPSRYAFGTLPLGPRAVPLTVVTGDQPAALFAWGEPGPGELFVNIGTGAFVQRVVPGSPPQVEGLLQSVAWQDGERSLGVIEGTVNGAGAALEWLAAEHGTPLQELLDAAGRWLAECADPPWFVNGVGGLGSPWWTADCPIAFGSDADLASQAVAVLESIVFLLQVNIEAIRAATDARLGPVGRVILSGGLARLDGVCQRLADLSGLPVERPAGIEATANGLAWLLSGTVPLAEAPARCFQPASRPRLHGRYLRWREALEAAIR
jgi:glycerol kinase